MPISIQPTIHNTPSAASTAVSSAPETAKSLSGTPTPDASGKFSALHEAFTKSGFNNEPRSVLQSRAQVAYNAPRAPLAGTYPTAFTNLFAKLQENPAALKNMIPQPANTEMGKHIQQMTAGTPLEQAHRNYSAARDLGERVHETGKEMATHMVLEEAAKGVKQAAIRAMKNIPRV